MKRIPLTLLVFCVSISSALASFHLWDDVEIFSTADGLVQYIEFEDANNGEDLLGGQPMTCVSADGLQTNNFTFPANLPSTSTAGRHFIVATPGFSKLPGGIQPDYTFPSGFLFPAGGTFTGGTFKIVNAVNATHTYSNNLPRNGINSLYPSLAASEGGTAAANTPSNFAQQAGSLSIPSAGSGDTYFQGLYHNNPLTNAAEEAIPHKDFLTDKFLEINYDQTNVNFFFLTASPAGDGPVTTRIRLYALGPNANFEQFVGATFQANIVLEPTNQFHNTPDVSGPGAFTNTLDLWKATWIPPRAFTGTVYYVPQVLINGGSSDLLNLTRVTNNTPGAKVGANDFYWKTNAQAFGSDFFGVDYSFNWTNPVPPNYDFIYHNSTNNGLPQDEDVPGVPGQKFFQYNYDSNTPSYVYMLAPPFAVSSAQTRFYYIGGGGEQFHPSQFFTNVVLTNFQFHALPASGELTVSVWRTEFFPPGNWNLIPTNFLFYANQVVTPNDGTTWLVQDFDNNPPGLSATNDLAQFFNSNFPFDRDWGFLPTSGIARTSIRTDFAYHNNTNQNPQTEAVPGLSLIPFLFPNYAATTTTFYVFTESPINQAGLGESLTFRLRTFATNEQFTTLNFVKNVTLDAGSPFHGLPAGGTKSLDLWKADWPQPTEGGVPVVAKIPVFYGFEIKATVGADNFQTDRRLLLANSALTANNYLSNPQYIGGPASDYFGNDYSYTNEYTANFDTDGDGVNNVAEILLGTSPTNPDSDSDGQSDGEEFFAGTSPTTTGDHFVANQASETNAQLAIRWFARSNRFYDVECATGTYSNNIGFVTVVTGVSVAVNGNVETNLPQNNALSTYRIRVR